MIYIIILCCVIIIVLSIKLTQKQQIDKSELNKYNKQVTELSTQANTLLNDIQHYKNRISQLNQESDAAIMRYNNSVRDKTEELENYFLGQKKNRQRILDEDIAQREKELNNKLEAQQQYYNNIIENAEKNAAEETNRILYELNSFKLDCNNQREEYEQNITLWKNKYESLIEPIKQYEKEKQDKLFYTIQLLDEFKDDIEFLLNTVALKVQHPDIISKLVWAEYVKPNLDETFKRIEIRPEPGIYKITNINNGKAYIGKSTDVKKRIADHFKSSIGIKAIADQAVHHAILKEGFWNWTIEIITYCDKDRLNELEKYYIDFFQTQGYGYNRNAGGGG